MTPDFGFFWAQIAIAVLCDRLHAVWAVATNEPFAAATFKAYSATARLRVVAALVAVRHTSDPDAASAVDINVTRLIVPGRN